MPDCIPVSLIALVAASVAGNPASYWTISSGDCKVDGRQCLLSPGFPGRYGNLERCDVSVHMPGKFSIDVESFDTESVHDVLTIDSHKYSGSLTRGGVVPQNVIPNGNIVWSSDKGQEGPGWKLCPVLLPTVTTTTMTPRAPDWSSSNWSVTTGDCFVNGEGCLASPNYPGHYGPNQHCTVAVHPTNRFEIHVEVFATEAVHDRLIINGDTFAGPNPLLEKVVPHDVITWTSDKGINGPGWKICPRPIPKVVSVWSAATVPSAFVLDDQGASWIAWADSKSIRYRFLQRQAELAFSHPCPGSTVTSMVVNPGIRRRTSITVNSTIVVGRRRREVHQGSRKFIVACGESASSRTDFWMVTADGFSVKWLGNATGPVSAIALYATSSIYWADPSGIFYARIQFPSLLSQYNPAVTFKPIEVWRPPNNELLNITGLALDSGTQYIYVANRRNQTVRKIAMYRRRRGGSSSTRDPILVFGQAQLAGLALDLQASTMYWSADGFIRRAFLNGSGIEKIGPSGEDVNHIALDINAGYVYWSRSSSRAISRANCLCQRPGCQPTQALQKCLDPCPAQIVKLNVSDEFSIAQLPETININVSASPGGHSDFFYCRDVGGSVYYDYNVYAYLRCNNQKLSLQFYNNQLRRRRTTHRRRRSELELDPYVANSCPKKGTGPPTTRLTTITTTTWTVQHGGVTALLPPAPSALSVLGVQVMQPEALVPSAFVLDDQDASWVAWADAKYIRYRFFNRKTEIAIKHPCALYYPGSKVTGMAVNGGTRRRTTSKTNVSVDVSRRRRAASVSGRRLVLACSAEGGPRTDFWLVSADGFSFQRIGNVTGSGPVTALATWYFSKLYWANATGVFSSPFRQSGEQNNFKPQFEWKPPNNELLNVTGLALHSAKSMIYLANRKDHTLRKISMSRRRRSSDRRRSTPTPYDDSILVTGQDAVAGLALDSQGDTMYWFADGFIKRARLNGSVVENIISNVNDISQIALDISSGHVYWSQTSSTDISRGNCLCQRPGCLSGYADQPCRDPCEAQEVTVNVSDEASTRLLPEVLKINVSRFPNGHMEFMYCHEVGGSIYQKRLPSGSATSTYFYIRCNNRQITVTHWQSTIVRRRRTDAHRRRRVPVNYNEDACPKTGTAPLKVEETDKAMDIGLLIGLIGGGVCLLLCCGFLVWRIRRKGFKIIGVKPFAKVGPKAQHVTPVTLGAGSRPANWTTSSGIHVVPDPSRIQDVQRLMDETWRSRVTRDRARMGSSSSREVPEGCRVASVLRVENHAAFKKYIDHKADISTRRAKAKRFSVLTDGHLAELEQDLNEMYLFHGTSPEAADQIAKGDFRLDKSGSRGGTMFGPGIYGAECPSKSDEYSREGSGAFIGQHAMIIFRATAGEVLTASTGDQSQRVLSGEFDSVCGDRQAAVGTYREMVFFHEAAAYAEYIVIYTRTYPK